MTNGKPREDWTLDSKGSAWEGETTQKKGIIKTVVDKVKGKK